ncbi:ethanolamine utilization protein EutA [Pseudomonas sp. ok272]|uniref:ethanolamine ammonia-lyase reactivating factor EutA n=1 Tax=unclassified Pseudomonas TaxID=196821 RepID=UPI0008CDB860|nr:MULTISPECIES: ethanolamine ammonia-lyase reactivating factor EutA [unclassified Pseudomonas]SEM95342.1 ethanolamine utilization protein EutA [Pseudomonas sp. ok272]SFM93016.1 ethanolamine utilization protein EutA [Pseudomonas sp. ok602]
MKPLTTGNQVLLLGLDFGSTTSSALIAQASISSHCITGRMALHEPVVLYRGEPVFTPFAGDAIDERAVQRLIEGWLADAKVTPEALFSGGVIITGLAAQRNNAHALADLVGGLIGNALITRADDGGLESWLAFMGSCSALSRFHGERPILNLDIGGGTTNAALGLAGNVLASGCHFIGARHFQCVPGSYQLCAISPFGQVLLDELDIPVRLGDTLETDQRDAIIGWYIAALEAIVSGDRHFFSSPAGQRTEQLPLHLPALAAPLSLTFSGGVGELLYRHLQGETLPGTTHYGDLGIDLALAIAAHPQLVGDANRLVPENRGRATVYGLTLHNTEISGSTLFLPQPHILPLKDLPIVARLPTRASLAQLVDAITLAATSRGGACLQLLDDGAPPGLDDIRQLGARLASAIAQVQPPAHWPLVLLLESNAGKALGNYASDWGRQPCNLVVIDEVRERHAHFINLGKPHQQIVPVAFYGVH